MKKKNQNINCDVISCKHNKNNEKCDLDEIKISSDTDTSTEEKDETICDSFEKDESYDEEEYEEGEEEEDIECDD